MEEWESYSVDEAQYHTDKYSKGYFRRRLPKYYRQMVNKKRKNRDRRELWKEVHVDGYEGLYSSWNGKDSDPAWYW